MDGSGIIFAALSAAVGLMIGVQGPVNAGLAQGLGSPIAAAAVSFAAGLLALVVACLVLVGPTGLASGWRETPAWLFVTGGLLGATYITAAAFLTPRLGAATFLVFVMAGQLAAALAIDQFGLFGLPVREITAGRALGTVLVISGAVMMRIF
jgi:transporter family-2 protein